MYEYAALSCIPNIDWFSRLCYIILGDVDHKRGSEAEVENLRDGSSKKNLRNNKKRPKELQIEKDIMWNFTDTSIDLFWALCLLWKRTDIQIFCCTGTLTDIDLEEDQGKMAGQHQRRLWRLKPNYAPSVPPYKGQNNLEEYCSKPGLPERVDIVFVARALS